MASLVVAGAIAAFLVLHVTGSPEQTAATFLTDWQTRTYSRHGPGHRERPQGRRWPSRCARRRRSSACAASTWCSAR